MNNICANCGGFIGDFIWSGDNAKICNCKYQKEELIADILAQIDKAEKAEVDWEDMYEGLREYLKKLIA